MKRGDLIQRLTSFVRGTVVFTSHIDLGMVKAGKEGEELWRDLRYTYRFYLEVHSFERHTSTHFNRFHRRSKCPKIAQERLSSVKEGVSSPHWAALPNS